MTDYEYIGLGGPFLEDFRLLHSRLGMENLTCIENNPETHRRQLFSLPGYVDPVFQDLADYLAERDLSETLCVIWLDFTAAASEEHLGLMASTVREARSRSIVKVTFNALGPRVERRKGEKLESFDQRRSEAARARLGRFAPASLNSKQLSRRGYGQVVLDSIKRALDAEMAGSARAYLGVNAFQYADRAPIVTATVVSCDSADSIVSATRLDRWEFFQPSWPQAWLIDMPVLSAFERVHVDKLLSRGEMLVEDPGLFRRFLAQLAKRFRMLRRSDSMPDRTSSQGGHLPVSGPGQFAAKVEFEMPSGTLGGKKEVLDSFRRFSRLYPHFARIEL